MYAMHQEMAHTQTRRKIIVNSIALSSAAKYCARASRPWPILDRNSRSKLETAFDERGTEEPEGSEETIRM